jgi:syntaxin 1B/2/3
METGDGERFMQHVIAEQKGRGEVMGLVVEIQERHGGVAQLERNLLELHQVFNDMAVLVEAQEEPLVNIKGNLDRARSYLDRGREELQVARKYKKSSRKWTCIVIGIGILVVVVVGIVLLIVL